MSTRNTIAVLSLSLMVLLLSACAGDHGPAIDFGVDVCITCGMVVDQPAEAAGLWHDDEFQAFCNPVCMIQAVNGAKAGGRPVGTIYVSDYTGQGLIEAAGAACFFGPIQTVMDSGVVAFADRAAADAFAREHEGHVAGFDHLRALHETPDKVLRAMVSEGDMEPAKLVAERGMVVSLRLTSALAGADLLSIRGYDSVDPMPLDPEGNETRITFVADKPGAGFPLVLQSSGQVVGQLVVTGAHLEEEEL